MKSILTRYIPLLILLSFIVIPKTYGDSNQDSIRYLIKTTKDSRLKVDLLNQLSKTYYNIDNIEAIRLANEAFSIGKVINYDEGLINSSFIIGRAYFKNVNYKKSLENYFEAVTYLKRGNNDLKLAEAYKNVALVYNFIENAQASIEYNNRCYNILKRINNSDLLVDCYKNYAMSYRLLKDHQKEMNFLNKSIELRKRDNQQDKLGIEYNKLGFAYWKLNQFDSAIKYFNRYLELSKQYKDSSGIALAYSNIGSALYSKGSYLESINYFNSSLKIKQHTNGDTRLELAQSYIKLGNLERACKLFDKVMDEKNGDHIELAKLGDSISVNYQRINNKDLALTYANHARDIKNELWERSKFEDSPNARLKYETEGMEEKIEQKIKMDSLKKSEQNNTERLIFLAIIAFFVVTTIALIIKQHHNNKMKKVSVAVLAMDEMIKNSNDQ